VLVHGHRRSCSKSRFSVIAMAGIRSAVNLDCVVHEVGQLRWSRRRRTPRIALLHRHDLLDVLDVQDQASQFFANFPPLLFQVAASCSR